MKHLGIVLYGTFSLTACCNDKSNASQENASNVIHEDGSENRLLERSERQLQVIYEEWFFRLKEKKELLLDKRKKTEERASKLQERKVVLTSQKSEYEEQISRLARMIEKSDDYHKISFYSMHINSYQKKLESIKKAMTPLKLLQEKVQHDRDALEAEFAEWDKEVTELKEKVIKLGEHIENL